MKREYKRREKFLYHGMMICRDYVNDDLTTFKTIPPEVLVAAEIAAMHTPQVILRSNSNWYFVPRYAPIPDSAFWVAELEYIPTQ